MENTDLNFMSSIRLFLITLCIKMLPIQIIKINVAIGPCELRIYFLSQCTVELHFPPSVHKHITQRLDDGGKKFLWHVSKSKRRYTADQHKRTSQCDSHALKIVLSLTLIKRLHSSSLSASQTLRKSVLQLSSIFLHNDILMAWKGFSRLNFENSWQNTKSR
jgi:hypothetical protein